MGVQVFAPAGERSTTTDVIEPPFVSVAVTPTLTVPRSGLPGSLTETWTPKSVAAAKPCGFSLEPVYVAPDVAVPPTARTSTTAAMRFQPITPGSLARARPRPARGDRRWR